MIIAIRLRTRNSARYYRANIEMRSHPVSSEAEQTHRNDKIATFADYTKVFVVNWRRGDTRVWKE